MLSYYFLKALGFLACLLPRRAADAIGWGLGYIAWPFIPRGRRRLAQENIRRCLGCGEAEAWGSSLSPDKSAVLAWRVLVLIVVAVAGIARRRVSSRARIRGGGGAPPGRSPRVRKATDRTL